MAPDPRIRALRLAHVHYQHPDLDKAVQFLIDFGLKVVERSDDKVYFAGYGIQPYCYVAQQSPDSKRHFLGGYWAVESLDDLLKASSLAGGGDIKENTAPGKGSIVEVQDPNGYIVGFVHGQILNNPSKNPPSTEPIQNGAVIKRRLGTVRRFSQGPSPVHKLGHYGFVVPPDRYEPTLQWYTTLLNLKPTDAIFNPETNKDESCFIHIDRGAEFTDHHSFFLATDPRVPGVFPHHSSFEVNDYDTQTLGHDWLRLKGYTNCWGVGRHVLGSQIFDYWFDVSGNIVEHYSDGDMVNEDTPLGREPAAPDSLYVWGPNVPLGFVTRDVQHAGIPAVPPPSVA